MVYAKAVGSDTDLYLLRIGGRNAVRLTPDSPADDLQPAFSPDGERIAFRSERDGGGVFLMSASGESVTRLTDFGYSPSWSPDGGEIVVAPGTFTDPTALFNNATGLSVVNVEFGADSAAGNHHQGTATQLVSGRHAYRLLGAPRTERAKGHLDRCRQRFGCRAGRRVGDR